MRPHLPKPLARTCFFIGLAFITVGAVLNIAGTPVYGQGLSTMSDRYAPLEDLQGAISGVLERVLIEELGGMKVDFEDSWGHTAKIWTGDTKVVWEGIRSRVEKIYSVQPDGLWQRGWVRLENARDNLDLKIRDARTSNCRLTFEVLFKSPVRAEVEVRQYRAGRKLYDVTAHGRGVARASLDIFAELHSEGGKTYLRYGVSKADMDFDNIVLDRVGYLAGYTARSLGDALTRVFREKKEEKIREFESRVVQQIKQSVEMRGLLAKLARPGCRI